MPQQSSMMTMNGEVRPGMAAPDETLYNMPPDAASAHPNQWVYGDPDLEYNGQYPTSGVSDSTVYDTVPGSAGSGPMPTEQPIPAGAAVVNGTPAGGVNGMGGMNGMAGMNGEIRPSGPSSSAAQSQRMKNPVSMELTHMPENGRDAYQASLRSLLDRNVGYFVVATFLIGTQQSITWQGILHTVGSDYLVLYQPDYERYISCDLYALKFVQFHNVKGVPYCAASQNWQGQMGW